MSTTKLITAKETMTTIGEYDPLVAQEIADRTDSLLIKIMVAEANKQIEDYLASPFWQSR